MKDNDVIHRFIFDNTDIRGEVVTLDRSLLEAATNQHLSLASTQLLGQFFTAITLISETLKFDGIMSLQVRGDGPVNLIMAEINYQGHLRGIIKFRPDIDKVDEQDELLKSEDLQQLFGKAVLTITLEPEQGERYQGIVALDKSTLAECLEDYFVQSEQLLTKIILFTKEKKAAGILLQALPGVSAMDDVWITATQLMQTTKPEELLELEHETLLFRLFNELPCRLFPPKKITFKCSCTYERCKNAIVSLGHDEALSLLQERDLIEINCEFCGKKYTFGDKQIERIFAAPSGSIH